MIRRPPTLTLTYTLFPYPTLFRSEPARHPAGRSLAEREAVRLLGETQPAAMAQRHLLAPVRRPQACQPRRGHCRGEDRRSEEHTSELQSLMRTSYAVLFLKKKKHTKNIRTIEITKHTATNKQ